MGVVLVFVSVFLYSRTYAFAGGAALFPRGILLLLVFFAVWIVIGGIKKTKKMRREEEVRYKGEEERLTFRLLGSPMSAFFIAVVYVMLLAIIGFFPATILFLTGYLWYGGVRDWKAYALTVAGLNLFIYLLFVLQLNVRLPPGILFQ
jgi:putative tricarboxylic transport membrane protein